jgi:hypothetical protein
MIVPYRIRPLLVLLLLSLYCNGNETHRRTGGGCAGEGEGKVRCMCDVYVGDEVWCVVYGVQWVGDESNKVRKGIK